MVVSIEMYLCNLLAGAFSMLDISGTCCFLRVNFIQFWAKTVLRFAQILGQMCNVHPYGACVTETSRSV